MQAALLPRYGQRPCYAFDDDNSQMRKTERQMRAARTSVERTSAWGLVTISHLPQGERLFLSPLLPNPSQLSNRSLFIPTCTMPITNTPTRGMVPPPASPRMNTESMSPLAGEMSALHDQLEELEEENAILRASDVGQLTKRNAQQTAMIKDLAIELNKLRRAQWRQDHTPASKGTDDRKRKLDDSQEVAGPSRNRADDGTSIDTEKTDRPQDVGKDPRKKPKLGLMSTANDFVTGDAQGRSAEFLALPAKRAERELKSQVEHLRRQNGTFFRRMQEAEKNWFSDKNQLEKLHAIVETQKETLAEQVKASAARKADFKRRTKDVDPLLEEISRLSKDDPEYAERMKRLLCKTIKVIENIASLDSFASRLSNNKDRSKEGVRRDANRAIERGPTDDKGKGKELAIASDIGSIYKDESVRSDQAGPPGPPVRQQQQGQERRHVSAPVPAGVVNDPRVPCERKPLGELPAEMFQLEDEVARKEAQQEEEAARHMTSFRPPPATWHGPIRPTTWPRPMPPTTWNGPIPMQPTTWSRAVQPTTWHGSIPMQPTTWHGTMRPPTLRGAMPPTTWPGAMRPY